MIVNKKYGFAYTHLQKCGGNTLKKYLLSIPKSEYVVPKKGYCHGSVKDMPQYKDLFNFATVRNPFTWYMSMYYFSKRANNQEREIFGDVNQVDFKTWLEKALRPKVSLKQTTRWDSEIGFEVPKDAITEGTLDVGWWSYRFLYGVSNMHERLFRHGTQKHLLHHYDNIVDVDCLIKMEVMDTLLIPVLLANTGLEKCAPLHKVPRENTTNYDKDIGKHFDDSLYAMVMDQDFLFFENHYDDFNEGVWNRWRSHEH